MACQRCFYYFHRFWRIPYFSFSASIPSPTLCFIEVSVIHFFSRLHNAHSFIVNTTTHHILNITAQSVQIVILCHSDFWIAVTLNRQVPGGFSKRLNWHLELRICASTYWFQDISRSTAQWNDWRNLLVSWDCIWLLSYVRMSSKHCPEISEVSIILILTVPNLVLLGLSWTLWAESTAPSQ